MAPLPELEVVEVDTPPCSPILFNDDSFDTPDLQQVASPVKRARSTRSIQRAKRQKNDDAPYSTPVAGVQADYDYTRESPDFDEVVVDGYAGYVAAAKGQLAGFYPVSDDLYVVQGWDEKFSCVKAGLTVKRISEDSPAFLEYVVSLTARCCWERCAHRVLLSPRPRHLASRLCSRTIHSRIPSPFARRINGLIGSKSCVVQIDTLGQF